MTDLVLARQWIDALRSGEYVQAKGALAKDNYTRFCCLGVACEIATIERIPSVNGYASGTLMGSSFESTKLPYELALKLDIFDDMTIQFKTTYFDNLGFSNEQSLVSLNDEYKFTFLQIADVLEWYYFGNEIA